MCKNIEMKNTKMDYPIQCKLHIDRNEEMHNSPGGSWLAELATFHALAMALSAPLASTFAAPPDSEVDTTPPNETIADELAATADYHVGDNGGVPFRAMHCNRYCSSTCTSHSTKVCLGTSTNAQTTQLCPTRMSPLLERCLEGAGNGSRIGAMLFASMQLEWGPCTRCCTTLKGTAPCRR